MFNGEILTFKLNETFILNFLWWWWNKTNACIRHHKHNYFNLAHHIICSSTFLNLILIRLNCLCHRTAKGLKKRHWNKKNEQKKKKKTMKKNKLYGLHYLRYITLWRTWGKGVLNLSFAWYCMFLNSRSMFHFCGYGGGKGGRAKKWSFFMDVLNADPIYDIKWKKIF